MSIQPYRITDLDEEYLAEGAVDDLIERVNTAGLVIGDAVFDLYFGRAWVVKGLKDWKEFCERYFGIYLYPPEKRALVAADMYGKGMSQPAIAAVLGVSDWTISNDIRSQSRENLGTDSDAVVVGVDGKKRKRKAVGIRRPKKPKPGLHESMQQTVKRGTAFRADLVKLTEARNWRVYIGAFPTPLLNELIHIRDDLDAVIVEIARAKEDRT